MASVRYQWNLMIKENRNSVTTKVTNISVYRRICTKNVTKIFKTKNAIIIISRCARC